MEPLQFCYWLQGFAEINGQPPTEAQWQAIREHLQTVFEKKTPKYIPRNTTAVPVYIPRKKTAVPVADSIEWSESCEKDIDYPRAVC